MEDNYNTIMPTTQGAVGLQGGGGWGGGKGKGSFFGMCPCQSRQSESSSEGNLGAQILVLTIDDVANLTCKIEYAA